MPYPTLPRLALAAALLLPLALTACDTAALDGGALTTPAALSKMEPEVLLVEADGTMRAVVEGEAGVEVAAPGGNRVAVVVTGNATFSYASLPRLRLNVHQTAGGEVVGGGRVTLYSVVTGAEHTTDVTAVCVKPIQGWGRTNYAVTVELAEPYRPYGSLAYTHLAVPITEDGHVDAMVMNTRPFCGGSISLYPPENRLTGNVQALLPGA